MDAAKRGRESSRNIPLLSYTMTETFAVKQRVRCFYVRHGSKFVPSWKGESNQGLIETATQRVEANQVVILS